MNIRKLLPFLSGGPGKQPPAWTEACPHESDVLSYIEGTLRANRREELESHFAGCADCVESLALFAKISRMPEPSTLPIASYDGEVRAQSARVLNMISEDAAAYTPVAPVADIRERQEKREGFYISAPRFAMAAAALVCIVVVGVVWFWNTDSAAERGKQALAAALKSERQSPVRISGGFDYSPVIVTRGAEGRDDDSNLQFERAFARLKSAEDRSAPAADRLVLAQAYLARAQNGDARRARTIIEEVAAQGEQSAEIYNDLGAAMFQLENYDAARDNFNKALAKNPQLHEALFNRALTQEKLKQYGQARQDWETFIASSPDGKWKVEAEQRLDLLRKTTGER
jgi:tetratricopeptide (TPR) repeat protein